MLNMRSPGNNPADSATPSGNNAPTIGSLEGIPLINPIRIKIRDAKRKLKKGPAAEMKKRFHVGASK
ncbi:hypothetical protein SDC9_185423 [bioreactor metagenome]|uniref:Uncharacterized protein n=1 Tax=bioreactor metagenome TaxID=1076179 RepID=A0A645HHN5_9ZZZZ